MLSSIFQKPWPAWLPIRLKRYIESLWVFSKSGQFRSALKGQCVDHLGNPVPWWSWPAINYLSQRLPLSTAHVFEWGAGNSTLFFRSRGYAVTSVEHDPEWYAYVKSKVSDAAPFCHLFLRTGIDDYIESIWRFGQSNYDIIVIDGRIHHPVDRTRAIRHECVLQAIKFLKPDGIIILDNADWLPMSRKTLLGAGFVEIPFVGHAPLLPYVTTTSFFVRSLDALKDFRSESYPPFHGSLDLNYECNVFPHYRASK